MLVGFLSAAATMVFWLPLTYYGGPVVVAIEMIGSVVAFTRMPAHRAPVVGVAAGLAIGLPFLLIRLSIFASDVWFRSVFG